VFMTVLATSTKPPHRPTQCEARRCSMKNGRPGQKYSFIQPRKWRQHACLDALRRQLEIATEELKRDPERASLVATLAEKYRRAHASWVADLRAGRPIKDRSTIVNQALEICKAEGKRAAIEFIRASIKANEGVELAPSLFVPAEPEQQSDHTRASFPRNRICRRHVGGLARRQAEKI
jgi:hypothetical protein